MAKKKKKAKGRWKGGSVTIDYEERLKVLRMLGFRNYQEYLASDMWSSIRAMVMEKARGRCRLCRAVATQVHHGSYSKEVMVGRNLHPLSALCAACHLEIECKPDGSKRCAIEVGQIFGEKFSATRQQKRKEDREARQSSVFNYKPPPKLFSIPATDLKHVRAFILTSLERSAS